MSVQSTRKLNAIYDLSTTDIGEQRSLWRVRGDIIKSSNKTVVATIFGEGSSLASAEDNVWVQAQDWVRKRGRARMGQEAG